MENQIIHLNFTQQKMSCAIRGRRSPRLEYENYSQANHKAITPAQIMPHLAGREKTKYPTGVR